MNCAWCQEPILPAEQVPQEEMHYECLIRAVAGSAAHQLGECSCFGGTREDPPGMTARQAALVAYETFKMLRDDGPLVSAVEKARRHWDELGEPYPPHLESAIRYLNGQLRGDARRKVRRAGA